MSSPLGGALNLRELESLAQPRLAVSAFAYYRSGADDELTLAENETAFARWLLRPRVLVDVSAVDTSIRLLGQLWSWPVGVAPSAAHKLACSEGELATARAARRTGTCFVLSTMSTVRLEDVAATHYSSLFFFQLYAFRDRGLTAQLVRRAEAAGFKALVVTVDAPFLGNREDDTRNAFSLPSSLRFENLAEAASGSASGSAAAADGSRLTRLFVDQINSALTWDDIGWLRSITSLPVLVKGVLTAEDARLAVDAGVAGIVVSNHGGRQLDTAISSLDALPEVVAVVAGRVPVLLDGGIRRGTDVLKAMALGASAVLLGRPVLYGLALGGEDGAAEVLAMLQKELRLAMALSGVTRLPPPRTLLIRRSAL